MSLSETGYFASIARNYYNKAQFEALHFSNQYPDEKSFQKNSRKASCYYFTASSAAAMDSLLSLPYLIFIKYLSANYLLITCRDRDYTSTKENYLKVREECASKISLTIKHIAETVLAVKATLLGVFPASFFNSKQLEYLENQSWISKFCEFKKADLTLKCAKETDNFSAVIHRELLILRNGTYFKPLLTGSFKEAKSSELKIELSKDALIEFRHFLYTEHLVLNESIAKELLIYANMIGFTDLKSLCGTYLAKTLSSERFENLVEIAIIYDCIELENICFEYMEKHQLKKAYLKDHTVEITKRYIAYKARKLESEYRVEASEMELSDPEDSSKHDLLIKCSEGKKIYGDSIAFALRMKSIPDSFKKEEDTHQMTLDLEDFSKETVEHLIEFIYQFKFSKELTENQWIALIELCRSFDNTDACVNLLSQIFSKNIWKELMKNAVDPDEKRLKFFMNIGHELGSKEIVTTSLHCLIFKLSKTIDYDWNSIVELINENCFYVRSINLASLTKLNGKISSFTTFFTQIKKYCFHIKHIQFPKNDYYYDDDESIGNYFSNLFTELQTLTKITHNKVYTR